MIKNSENSSRESGIMSSPASRTESGSETEKDEGQFATARQAECGSTQGPALNHQ